MMMERTNLWQYLERSRVGLAFRDFDRLGVVEEICDRVEIVVPSIDDLGLPTGNVYFCKGVARYEFSLDWRGSAQNARFSFPGKVYPYTRFSSNGDRVDPEYRADIEVNFPDLRFLTVCGFDEKKRNYIFWIKNPDNKLQR